jgi:uncharacterized protein
MALREFTNATDFLQQVEPFLARQEEANSLFLGLLRMFCSKPPEQQLYFACDEDEGEVTSAVFFTGLGLILTEGANPTAYVAPILDKGLLPPSVVGPNAPVGQFTKAWMSATNSHVVTTVRQRIYSLREVVFPQGVEGEMQVAPETSVDLAAEWARAFHAEAIAHEPGSDERLRQFAADRIRDQRLFFWMRNGQPVSMAALGRTTGRTVTVNAVYTPPEFRRQGYASALVASLSSHALAQGPEAVVLYTDLANPTSNRIYQDVGFRPVCDSLNLWFAYPD